MQQPEIDRRTFLSTVGWIGIALSGGLAALGNLLYLKPAVDYGPPSRILAGKPENYKEGIKEILENDRVVIVRDRQGFAAISLKCTHLGCTVAVSVCTYNRSDRLPGLVAALRRQECPIPWEILLIDNNSMDDTQEVLAKLAAQPGTPLRFVKEEKPGIVPARDRALEECLASDYMVFMDDDELPRPGMLAAAVDALVREDAEFMGGRVVVHFESGERPVWLGDELLGFLAEVNYSAEPFWITNNTPIWTSNAAYNMKLFRDGLRFDPRYSRVGKFGFGGEDIKLFETLLERGVRIRYRPDMVVEHFVEKWRLRRSYFLKIHYTYGIKKGYYDETEYLRMYFGIPPFFISQAVRHGIKTVKMFLLNDRYLIRQGMNFTYSIGMIKGQFNRWLTGLCGS